MSAVLSTSDQETLTPIERLEALCDPGSLDVIRSEVVSSHMGLKARAGDGVVGGAGLVDGRPVFCYAQDNSYVGGSLGEMHAETIVRVLELADRARAPVVGFVGSGGARMQEGVCAHSAATAGSSVRRLRSRARCRRSRSSAASQPGAAPIRRRSPTGS
ncbi:carboxyl transferase domain-containing protein [Conexibacter sp. S30A1]|uniref:carboxyl transferase domain-containing protein n=1 Tax=Conexibacter sp. S30A1 TaxID=2937800 RepID=UPI00200D506E|nr:carboxyl transferase domain-containing protein [Conexibacter sp. S30A1]